MLIALTLVAAHEVIILRNSNVATTMLYTDFQKIVSVLFICAAVFVSYRALGSILPGLCLIFLVYTFYGSYLPGSLQTSRVSVYRMATYLMVSSEGLFGSALNVAAIYIFLFVLFGSVLSFIGAGEFFVDIASAAFGHFVGGPAQAAVYSSMLLGIVNGSINITGLGLKISTIITMLAGGNILIMGLLTAVVCIILGMGLPTSACYIILSVLVAPAMVKLGVSLASAHLFVLYFGVIAAITPPVALAVFAAIGISGGDMWKTGLQAVKFALAGFLIPFVFLFNNNLVMYHAETGMFGMDAGVALTFVLTAVGSCTLSCAVFGWLMKDLNTVERIVLAIVSVMALCNHIPVVGFVGMAAIVLMAVMFKMQTGKAAPTVQE